MNQTLEKCCDCDEPTGNAGRCDDSLFCEHCECGPFCCGCFDSHDCRNSDLCPICHEPAHVNSYYEDAPVYGIVEAWVECKACGYLRGYSYGQSELTIGDVGFAYSFASKPKEVRKIEKKFKREVRRRRRSFVRNVNREAKQRAMTEVSDHKSAEDYGNEATRICRS